ncbi:MAG: hypothetical protein ACJAV5_002145 [Vicingaceae bacterium]|jgi:hypothetical protein
MQNQNKVFQNMELLLSELKRGASEKVDILIKISEELSRVSSTSVA